MFDLPTLHRAFCRWAQADRRMPDGDVDVSDAFIDFLVTVVNELDRDGLRRGFRQPHHQPSVATVPGDGPASRGLGRTRGGGEASQAHGLTVCPVCGQRAAATWANGDVFACFACGSETLTWS